MLSPHEFATLLLVQHGENQVELDSVDLGVLLEEKLVRIERFEEGQYRPASRTLGLLCSKPFAAFAERAPVPLLQV